MAITTVKLVRKRSVRPIESVGSRVNESRKARGTDACPWAVTLSQERTLLPRKQLYSLGNIFIPFLHLRRNSSRLSFHRYGLRQITRLIHIRTTQHRHVIR